MRFQFSLLAFLAIAPAALAQVPQSILRHENENLSGTSIGGTYEGGVIFSAGGNVTNGNNGVIPAGGGMQLRESAFGQPSSAFLTPYDDFPNQVLFGGGLNAAAAVYPQLYPAGYGTSSGVTGSRSQIVNGGSAFRYKWLMFGQDPGGTPAILNLFEQTFGDVDDADNPWFNDSDRANARAQIVVLREALSYSPLDRQLHSALLDVYYDLAVAEMQFVRKRQAKLATLRLGLTLDPLKPFIIDQEIETYEKLVEITGGILSDYGELLSFDMEGFEPGDVDPNSGGAPFGYWLFQREVPRRNQVPTQYATSAGGPVEDVIDPTVPDNTFSGYKDYRTVLTVLGQNIQFRADLARMLGMRRAQGDITEGRSQLSTIQGPLASDFDALRHLFAGVDFDDPQFDASGIRGAITLVETAMNSSIGVRGFLNGTSNVLGLDPNFLILLPADPQAGKFDTYDILADKLGEVAPNGSGRGPLAIALDALLGSSNPSDPDGAVQAYQTFRESVDQVSEQLAGLEDDFAERLEDITGYTTQERATDPGIFPSLPETWDGTPNPAESSELKTAQTTIDSLKRQTATLGQITLQLLDDVKKANEAVAIADGIDETITGAQASYLGETSSAWTEIHVWAGLAAGAQAVADTAFAVTGADAPWDKGAAGIAGGINAGVQTAAATRTSMREEELDEAAIGFETTLALAEVPLTVKQSELELGALMREAYANRLEIEDNLTSLAQALADKNALIREVDRLTANIDADRSSLASRYFADPIHYVRAERELLKADAEFRRAQRWVFFTARALEYKWQQRFSYADPSLGADGAWDIGTILKARNATELKTIVQKMAQFDGDRTASPGTLVEDRAYISLRDHVLTPNPDDINLLFNPLPADAGVRFDSDGNRVVTKVERFRTILTELAAATGGGAIEITFDTTKLQNLGGQFFAGPDYSTPTRPTSGLYRDKIEWLAVNIIAEDAPELPSIGVPRSGSMRYGGNTFFRTRVPPCWTRAQGNVISDGSAFDATKDFPGEFIVAPVRFYQDTNFTGIFDVSNEVDMTSVKIAYTGDSAQTNTAVLAAIVADLPGAGSSGYRRTDFKERSVAATRWTLRINTGQVDISKLEDIEIIIQHKAYTRPKISCPPLNK